MTTRTGESRGEPDQAVPRLTATQALLTAKPTTNERMSEEQVSAILQGLGGLLGLLSQADPSDKAEIYSRLDLGYWRRSYPAGTLQRLTDADEQAGSAVTAAIDALRELDVLIEELQERSTTARGLLDEASDREREASGRARDLQALAANVDTGAQSEIDLPSLRAILQIIKDTTETLQRQRGAHQENAKAARTLAQQHRSLAGAHRAEADVVPASTRARAAAVPDEPLPHLRQRARTTHDAYLAMAADQDLRARAESAATRSRELHQQLALRDCGAQAVR